MNNFNDLDLQIAFAKIQAALEDTTPKPYIKRVAETVKTKLDETLDELRYRFQVLFKGYGDRDIINLDISLLKDLEIKLKNFKKYSDGFSSSLGYVYDALAETPVAVGCDITLDQYNQMLDGLIDLTIEYRQCLNQEGKYDMPLLLTQEEVNDWFTKTMTREKDLSEKFYKMLSIMLPTLWC